MLINSVFNKSTIKNQIYWDFKILRFKNLYQKKIIKKMEVENQTPANKKIMHLKY